MPKKKSNYYLRQLRGKGEEYTQVDYQELLEHEGEFRYSDFKKWNMSKLLRTSRVLRDEAFRRASEFEKAVKDENLSLSPAYSRLEERNITWIKDRVRLPFGSNKVQVINNIIQTLSFLDNETSTVEGWKKVVKELSEKVSVDFKTLIDRGLSQEFFDLYYKVTDYLTREGIVWTPSETMKEIQFVTSTDEFNSADWNNQNVIEKIQKRVKERLQSYYETKKERGKDPIYSFFTTKK